MPSRYPAEVRRQVVDLARIETTSERARRTHADARSPNESEDLKPAEVDTPKASQQTD
jgi:hypothetical protein